MLGMARTRFRARGNVRARRASRFPARIEITSRPAVRSARRGSRPASCWGLQASTTVSAEARSGARSGAAVTPVRRGQNLRGVVIAADAGDIRGRRGLAGQQSSDHGRRHAPGADEGEPGPGQAVGGRVRHWRTSSLAARPGAAEPRRFRRRDGPPSTRRRRCCGGNGARR